MQHLVDVHSRHEGLLRLLQVNKGVSTIYQRLDGVVVEEIPEEGTRTTGNNQTTSLGENRNKEKFILVFCFTPRSIVQTQP